MATRMQQRRGTAAQWISTNTNQGPVLNSGEIGFESDTGKFKIGDGVNHWINLPYFVDLNAMVAGAPGLLNSIDELAAALGDDPAFFTTVATNLTNHQNDTTDIHGIADTSLLVTTTGTQTLTNKTITTPAGLVKGDVGLGNVDNTTDANKPVSTATQTALDLKASTTDLSNHSSATENVHGILDTDDLATKEYVTTAVGNATIDQTVQGGVGITWNIETEAFDLDSTLSGLTLTSPVINTPTGITKTDVGLANVDNTSDADKPVSTATQTALDAKLASATAATTYAPLASPTFTGTVTLPANTISQSMMGDDSVGTNELGGLSVTTEKIADGAVTNAKVSASAAIAQSKIDGLTTDLAAKAPLASPALTGTPTAPTATAGTNSTQVATTAYADAAVAAIVDAAPGTLNTLNEIAAAINDDASYAATITTALGTKAPLESPTFTGTVSGVTATHVGLGNVDNTSDADKPVSTATQTALNAKAPTANPTFTGTVDFTGATVNGISSYSAPTLGSTSISSGATVTTVAGLTLTSPVLTGTVTLPQGKLTGGSTTVSANTATTVSTVALADFTTMEYIVSIKQGSKIRSSKVLVQTDGTIVDSVEHSILETGGSMTGINVTAAVASTNAILQVTVTDAATTNAVVKVINTII